MNESRVADLGRRYHASKSETDSLREKLRQAIIDGAKTGIGTMQLARESGYEREIIRRILKKARDAGELPPLSD